MRYGSPSWTWAPCATSKYLRLPRNKVVVMILLNKVDKDKGILVVEAARAMVCTTLLAVILASLVRWVSWCSWWSPWEIHIRET